MVKKEKKNKSIKNGIKKDEGQKRVQKNGDVIASSFLLAGEAGLEPAIY